MLPLLPLLRSSRSPHHPPHSHTHHHPSHRLLQSLLLCPLLLLLLVILFSSSPPSHLLVHAGSSAPLHDQIYTTFVNQGYCIRLAHQTGVAGCATGIDGVNGKIRLAKSQDSLDALIADQSSDRLAVVITPELVTRTNLIRMRSELNLAGIMILPSAASDSSTTPGSVIPPAGGFSPTTPRPQFLPYIPSSTVIPDRPTRTPIFNNTYEWNPLGQELERERFDFAIVSVTQEEKDYLLRLGDKNEANAQSGDFIYNYISFNYYMYGKTSTPQCLYDRTCMPVGGYSVWGTIGNMTSNGNGTSGNTTAPAPTSPTTTPKPFLLLTTKMDSTGFFHQLSPGADDSQASIAVLTAALAVLSNATDIANLPTQILFAFFQGETYSHVGSRKFVDDINNFVCTSPGSASGAQCLTPYKYTLDFQDVTSDRIAKIIEVGSIGLNATVFVHRQRDGNNVTDGMIATLTTVAANMTTPVTIAPALNDTPGIPPSCSEAFIEQRPSTSVIVLTDHAGPYTNKYMHSQYDSSLNLLTESIPGSTSIQHASLCQKATLLARTAWIEAGGDPAMIQSLNADCALINQMIHCLVEDYKCDLITQYAPTAYTSTSGPTGLTYPSHYTSIYNLQPDSYVDGTSLFLYRLVASFILNATTWKPPPTGYEGSDWPTKPNNIHVHDAVDPNLVFDQPSNRWKIKRTANDYALWTESNWDNQIAWMAYRKEDPKYELINLLLGLAIAAGCVVLVGFAMKYCEKKFKRL